MIVGIFDPQVRHWANQRRDFPPDILDDIVQDVLTHFLNDIRRDKYAYLLKTDAFGLVMGFLKTRTYWVCADHLRHQHAIPLDDDAAYPDSSAEAQLEQVHQHALGLQVLALVRVILDDPRDFLVWYLRFVQNMPPREIWHHHHDRFADMAELRRIIPRVKQRVATDAHLHHLLKGDADDPQKPHLGASLEMRMDSLDEEYTVMSGPCTLDESILLDYISGVATAEERALVEQTPDCRAAAQRLGQQVKPLLRLLHRLECPPLEALIAYHEQRLASSAALEWHQHIVTCVRCQDELALFAAIDAAPPLHPPGIVRRIVEALFQSPLGMPHPVRGGGLYTTPHLQIDLSMATVDGPPRRWTIWGEVRTTEGLAVPNMVEAVTLQRLDRLNQPAEVVVGTVEADGAFVVAELPAGRYRLGMQTAAEEVVIVLNVGEQL